jgi:type IV pilus assembly protein PilA
MLKQMKKRVNGKKGFTLVEIIVVLVIIAILAAAGIPAMLGFINQARERANVATARMVYVAAQAVATQYSNVTDGTAINSNMFTHADALKTFTDMLGDDADVSKVKITSITDGKVESIKYETATGKTVTIKPGSPAVIE